MPRPLLVLFAMACFAVHLRMAADFVRNEFTESERSRQPLILDMWDHDGSIVEVRPEAAEAGIRAGDRLEQLEGMTYTGKSQYALLLSERHPGSNFRVRVRREGVRRNADIVLRPVAPKEAAWSLEDWLFILILRVGTPLISLALGFWVAFRRPHDRLALILLGLLLAFAQITSGGLADIQHLLAWEDGSRQLGLAHRAFWWSTWQFWLLLFALHFPNRAEFIARRPWAQWIVLAPVFAYGVFQTITFVGSAEALPRFQALAVIGSRTGLFRFMLQVGVLVGALVVLIGRWRSETNRDARRRMRVLAWGTLLGWVPSIAVELYQEVQGVRLGIWIWLPAFSMLLLFPLTLAYVIIVQRAMDVQVVLRQGLKYTLARRGLIVIRVLAAVIVVSVLAASNDGELWVRMLRIAAGIAIVLMFGGLAEAAGRWIDRRFFREQYRADQVLIDLAQKVSTIGELKPLLETIAGSLADSLHVKQVALWLWQAQGWNCAYAVGMPEGVVVAAPDVIETARPVPVDDGHLLLPLRTKDRTLGVLTLGPKMSEEPYSPTDLRLLESVASQAALSLENSMLAEAVAREIAQREVLGRELQIAREVQERLFPQVLPDVAGVEYAGICKPAREVGGDYYDFLELPRGHFGIAIGDVAGKGISASLLMASLQAALRGQVMAELRDCAELLTNLNRLVYDASPSNRYATFFFGQYDPLARELRFANGGHNPPLILRPDGDVRHLQAGGPPIGLFRPAQFTSGVSMLEPGDTLVAFTDGISEAPNSSDEEFGEDRLADCVRETMHLPVREQVVHVVEAVQEFTAGMPQHDDMTVVIVRVRVG